MRTQEIYEKVMSADVDSLVTHFPNNGVISNLIELRTKLESLAGIPGFDRELSVFSNSIIFRTQNAQIQIPSPEWAQAAVAKQNPDSVFVKLPELSDFSKVLAFEERLEKAISQIIYHSSINARLVLASWERGSPFWLELMLGGQAAVCIVGAAAWAGAVVYKKIQEGRMHQEYVRGLKLKNENLEELVGAEKRMLSELVDAEARNIALNYYNGDEAPETLERVKFTIKEFAKMIEEGAEIHPALQAPEPVKNLFPDFKNLLTVESKIKQITENAKQDGSEVKQDVSVEGPKSA
jgi:hypothetical protein